jgi:hypothetical protein
MNAHKKISAANLSDLVNDALSSYPGDITSAANFLLDRARGDRDLYQALLGQYELDAARRMISAAIAKNRKDVWTRTRGDFVRPKQPDARVQMLARANSTALMDFPLPGGKPLHLATAEEVAQGAIYYLERGRDAVAKGTWLNRIADGMNPGVRVSEAYGETDLQRLKGDV